MLSDLSDANKKFVELESTITDLGRKMQAEVREQFLPAKISML